MSSRKAFVMKAIIKKALKTHCTADGHSSIQGGERDGGLAAGKTDFSQVVVETKNRYERVTLGLK